MIAVDLPSGRTILLPTIHPGDDQMDATSDDAFEPDDGYTDVGFSIDFAEIAETAAEIGNVLRKAAAKARPTRVTAEVTVGIDAKSGKIAALFVESNATAGVKLTFEWERPTDSEL